MQKKALKFSNNIFWDINPRDLSIKKNLPFIIERVFTYGNFNDYKKVIKIGGYNNIRQQIKKIPYLPDDVISFLSVIFDLKLKDFKCYTKRQLKNKR